MLNISIGFIITIWYNSRLAFTFPTTQFSGVMSPFMAKCTRSRCKGGGNDLSALAIIEILRITDLAAEIGMRSDLNASPRTRRLPISKPFRTWILSPQPPYILPSPHFRVPSSFFSSDRWVDIMRAWFKRNRNLGKSDAGIEGDEKRSVISSWSRIDFFSGARRGMEEGSIF